MGKTPIQWSEFSINPIRARFVDADGRTRVGHYCEKVSAGCKNCYASRMQGRFGLPQFQEQRRAGVEPFLDAEKLAEVIRRKKPTKFFWCDMTDMFGDWVQNEWIAACFGVMAATPQHTHQVLTKRAKRMREWFAWIADEPRRRCDLAAKIVLTEGNIPLGFEVVPWPIPNVHLGVSVEDQQRVNERIPELLTTPAVVRWVSAEPLLGPVDFMKIDLPGGGYFNAMTGLGVRPSPLTGVPIEVNGPGLSWIVVGGESGQRARPFDITWARSIRDQCEAAGVACFIKQLGKNPIYLGAWPKPKDSHGGDMAEWPLDLRVREFPR